jgi:hypothetical protein
MHAYEDTLLWKRFIEKANDHQRAEVRSCIKKAVDKLILVRDTFPTYTLHNEQHSLNIINLMGELLGDRIGLLDPLEATLLILSAYYHDIGMVFTREEVKDILEEVEFNNFLQSNSKAEVLFKEFQQQNPGKEKDIPDEIGEWYCRWVHPDRSSNIVKSRQKILWNNFPINGALALICRSHG